MDGEQNTGRKPGPEVRLDEEFEGLVPGSSKAEYFALKAEISVEGLREPLVVWRPPGEEASAPVLLDGHARLRACSDLGVDYELREISFTSREDAATWVILKHLGRKSLTTAGRCEVAISLEPRLKAKAAGRRRRGARRGGRASPRAGADKDRPDLAGASGAEDGASVVDALLAAHGVRDGKAIDQAAKMAGVGSSTVANYKRIKAAAEDASDPELAKRASGLLKGLQGAEPKLKVGGAYKSLTAAKEQLAAERWREAREKHVRDGFGKPGASGGNQGGSDGKTTAETSGAEAAPGSADREAEEYEARSGYPLQGLPSRVPRDLDFWTPESPVWSCGEFQEHVEDLDLPGFSHGEVGLLLTDPPYGRNYARSFEDDKESADENLIRMFELFEGRLAPNAHVVFFCGERQEGRMRAIMEKHAPYLTERRRLGWVQTKPSSPTEADGRIQGDPHSFGAALEIAIHATRGHPQRIKPRNAANGYVAPRIPVETRGHETEKPAGMLRHIIEAATVPGEVVADPFGGVASTLEATIRSGRRGWSCEDNSLHHIAGTRRINGVLEEIRKARRRGEPSEGFNLLLQLSAAGDLRGDEAAKPEPLTSLPADPLGGIPAVIWGFGDPPEAIREAHRRR